jgi:2,3-bisphosphoglycerate-independent phosphoglycerate mutase
MANPFQKVFLIILDGFGLSSESQGNSIHLAQMPYLNRLAGFYPTMGLVASGLFVGLPWGQYGNSEVGHSAIGAGRVIVQDLARISMEILNGMFFTNKAFVQAADHCKKHDSTLHLIGCISPGGIHSHEDHLIALLELAHQHELRKVHVHMITDGQDAGPQDAVKSLDRLSGYLEKSGAKLATISGRTYAMDRVLNWPLTQLVWDLIVEGKGPIVPHARQYLEDSYQQGIFDHDMPPAIVGAPESMSDDDAVIFFNFRNDRMRQLVAPFVTPAFEGFSRPRLPQNLNVVTMTPYDDQFPVGVAYEAPVIPHSLGEMVSLQGWKQYRIAEKEKEAHVTNFFNGGRITPFPGEERIIVSSRMLKGDEYLEHPEMSAAAVAEEVLKRSGDDVSLFVINFANPDMIGHTGNLNAAIKSLVILDGLLEKMITPLIEDPSHVVIVTADHGNSEEMIDPLTRQEDTQHSTRNVPCIVVAKAFEGQGQGNDLATVADMQPKGTLVDIAPTVLGFLGLPKPPEMTGSSLITL